MNTKVAALLLGGVLPALLLGFSSIAQKLATTHGMATGPFLIGAGLTSAVVGAAFATLEHETTATRSGIVYTLAYGALWALAMGCVGLAIKRFAAPISQLVPLFNMNTLVAVLLALVVLGEWRTVNAPRVLLAAVLIISGGILAARA